MSELEDGELALLAQEQADEIERLRAIEQAARWVTVHVPVEHIYGKVSQGHYQALVDVLREDEDG